MEIKKPRIGVDVDGVLANFLAPAFKVLEGLYGKSIDQEALINWDLDKVIPSGKSAEFWEHIGIPGFHNNLYPYPGAQVGMKALAEVADIFIVTSHLWSGKTWVNERDKWLKEWFGIKHDKIVHTRSKFIFYGRALVDDKPKNVHDWQAEHPTGIGVLWDRPYNRHETARLKTNSWEELVKAVEGLK